MLALWDRLYGDGDDRMIGGTNSPLWTILFKLELCNRLHGDIDSGDGIMIGDCDGVNYGYWRWVMEYEPSWSWWSYESDHLVIIVIFGGDDWWKSLCLTQIMKLTSQIVISGRTRALQAVGGGDNGKQVVPALGLGGQDDQSGNLFMFNV